jgi:hypothetical protein
MARHMIVAQFDDYADAHRSLCELIRIGIRSNHISLVAGDRSFSHPAKRDFGILEEDAKSYLAAVRRGRTLLAVQADGAERARVAEIIEHHAPIEIDNGQHIGAMHAPPRP